MRTSAIQPVVFGRDESVKDNHLPSACGADGSSGVILSLLVTTALLACTGEQHIGGGVTAVTCDGDPFGNPAHVHTWTGPNAFKAGGIATAADAWIVAGMERTDFAGAGRDYPGEVRILHQTDGEIGFPLQPGDRSRIVTATPVALDTSRWGIVWGEPAPPPEVAPEQWPPWAVTKLWLSRYGDGDWLPPRQIAQGAYVDWETRSTVRHDANRNPVAMVASLDPTHSVSGRLLFGRIEEQLQPLPLPPGLNPQDGSFDIDQTGAIVAVVLASHDDRPRAPIDLYLVESPDGGQEWSDPHRIGTIPRRSHSPLGFKVLFDRDGTLHVLWEEVPSGSSQADSAVRHVWLAQGADDWHWMRVPVPGLLRWAAGIDRCGRFRLILEVLVHPTNIDGGLSPHLRTTEWLGRQWSERTEWFPQVGVTELFEGRSPDGTWKVGWSGWPETSQLWLATP